MAIIPLLLAESSSRCFVVSLLLVLAALVASDVYLSFPNRRNLLLLFPQPLLSRRPSRQRGGGEGGACDIFRGEWVPDPDAPYYTNDTCKVIHEHYDCMRYGKPDLGFVNWRWRPNVTDLTPRYALRMATRAALRALSGSGADGSGRFRGTALLRTVDPSQYEDGEWNGDGNCVRTAPYRRGQKKVEGFERDFRTLQVEELASAAKAATDNGSKVRMLLMDTTEAMILRADAHPSKYRGWTPEKHFTLHNDCVHWCLPGAIDTWNDMLLHMLK